MPLAAFQLLIGVRISFRILVRAVSTSSDIALVVFEI